MTTHRLRDVALVLTSNVDKVIDPNEHPVRLCNYVDVYKNNFIRHDMVFNPGSATISEIKKFKLKVDDVVITKDSEARDDIGVPALVKSTDDDLVCGYHLSILRADRHQMSGPFLYWHLLSKKSQEDFGNAANGVTRFGLTLGGIKNIPINVPDLPTQRAIADFLDRETARIDSLIEKKQRLVELLGERLISLVTQVTKSGLKNESQIDTGIDWWSRAPKSWDVYRIANLFDEVKETGEDGLPVLSVSINWGISDVELTDEDRHRVVNLIEDKAAYKRAKPGDLVYNMMRAWQGGFGVAKVDGLVSPAYVVARPKKDLHPVYFEHLLRTPSCVEQFHRASKGIADFRQRLYWEHFRQIRLVLPTYIQQVEIASHIESEQERTAPIISKTNVSIDRLKEYRSALITSAVTGQIDVSTYAKSSTTDRQLDAIQAEMS